MSGPIALGGPLLTYLTQALNARSLGRRTPAKSSASKNYEALDKGYEKRVEQIGGGRKAPEYDLVETTPRDDFNPWLAPVDPTGQNPLLFAGQGADPKTGREKVLLNPNIDSSFFAHELGHIASKQTDIGRMVRDARNYIQANPKIGAAIALSSMGLAGGAAALNPGDDDLATSIAIATAANLPTLIDEGLATKNGLAIMENAGQRATLGQRGRLAGGYLSYLIPAIVGGGTANFFGNLIDENE